MAAETQEVKFTPSLREPPVEEYDTQLGAKRRMVEAQFAEFNPPALEVFPSQPKNYRMR